jgi:hypothetical protein
MYTQKDGVAHQSIVPDDQMLYFTPELGIRHPQARFTVVEDPIGGTLSGVPLSAVKVTVNEREPALELVKYNAEYQPPPNTNCERRLTGAVAVASPKMRTPV